MPQKVTRLELIIIVAALAVLVFSNRPPQPGSADTRMDTGLTTENESDAIPPFRPGVPQSPDVRESVMVRTDSPTPRSSTDAEPDNLTLDSIPQPQPKRKRIGMVDARQCDSLKYPNVMYGEIAVRWVWDGTRFVPTTVCEVKESSGVITVWSLDERHDGVTVAEVPPEQVPAY